MGMQVSKGASIQQLNAVRRVLSQVKGGGLLERFGERKVRKNRYIFKIYQFRVYLSSFLISLEILLNSSHLVLQYTHRFSVWETYDHLV